jgi:hypothetical protein
MRLRCFVVHPEGVGDGADRPVLGVEEAEDLGALQERDHRAASAPGRGSRAEEGQRDVADPAGRAATAGTARPRVTRGVWSVDIGSVLLAPRACGIVAGAGATMPEAPPGGEV